MMRAFLALPLPEPLVQRLMLVQQMLPLPRPAARAVAPENLHLTLVFLGEQPEPVLVDLHHALERLSVPGFALRLRGIDGFGGQAPRSLHAGCAPCPGLEHLQRKLTNAARGAGIALERRRFVAHVTLARLNWRQLAPPEAERLSQAVAGAQDFSAGPAMIEAFALFRSHLGRSGAHYEELARYPLAPARE